jgi:hypothetical protein
MSCQVPPPPTINENAPESKKDKISIPEKQLKKPKSQKVEIPNTPVIQSSKKSSL